TIETTGIIGIWECRKSQFPARSCPSASFASVILHPNRLHIESLLSESPPRKGSAQHGLGASSDRRHSVLGKNTICSSGIAAWPDRPPVRCPLEKWYANLQRIISVRVDSD